MAAHDPTDDLACNAAVEIMTEYLEGALPDVEARRLDRHLDACPGCSEYLAQMRTIAGSLGELTEGSIPATMRDDLVAAFRAFRRD